MGMRGAQIQLFERQLARVQQGCARLALSCDFTQLRQELLAFAAQMEEGVLKLILTRGEGQRGYALPVSVQSRRIIQASARPAYPAANAEQGVRLFPCVTRLAEQPLLAGLKHLNRLEQVMLKKEAEEKAWIEALVTDMQGKVVEGISSNCFMQINNTWISPELRYNGVHGVMRAEILQRMQQQHISCQLRSVDVDEIPYIQSLFFCNALSPMKIVQSLDGRTLAVQPCVELFENLQLQQFKSHV